MAGYIKDHRKELDSEIWTMPPLYHRVWQYLKYKVNHHEATLTLKDGSPLTIQPGQHLTSIRSIAKGVGWHERGKLTEPNPKMIDTVLKWLKDKEMIAFEQILGNTPNGVTGNGSGNTQSNSLGTLVTLINWGFYQFSENQSNTPNSVTGNSFLSEKVTEQKELINNTTTTAAHESETMNLAKPISKTNPLGEILDAYCNLHSRLDIHIPPKQREIMGKMIAGGVPSPFIITTMTKLYEEKRKRDEEEYGRFQQPSSFKYYEDALWEAWRNENTQTTPVPSGTVAPGRSRQPQPQIVTPPSEFVIDEEDEITKLMRKVSDKQHA